MPKPSEEILAWIKTLTPANELAVRMAYCINNPWCEEDAGWQKRIEDLEAELLKSPADRPRYEARAREMARDMDAAVCEMKEQAAAPPHTPTEPPATE